MLVIGSEMQGKGLDVKMMVEDEVEVIDILGIEGTLFTQMLLIGMKISLTTFR